MKYHSARMVVLLIIFCFAGLAAGCTGIGTRANPAESDYSALVAAPDRTEADLKTDQRRNPAMLLAFRSRCAASSCMRTWSCIAVELAIADGGGVFPSSQFPTST